MSDSIAKILDEMADHAKVLAANGRDTSAIDGWGDRLAALSAPEASGADVETLARALVERLDAIHADPIYMGVWVTSQTHVGPYRGPKYDQELDALRSALNPAPPTSGEDSFVMVESAVRSLPPGYAFADAVEHANPAPPTSGTEVIQQHLVTKFRDGHTKVVDITPQPTTPADESGAFNALADDEAERQQYERDKLDPSNCLTTPADESGAKYEAQYATAERLAKPPATTRCESCSVGPGELHAFDCIALDDTPTAEPRAAAQECAPSIAQIGAEAWHLAADLDDLAANGIATAGRAADFIRARLQPSGAGEDAARYEELIYAVASKFPGESRHETALRYIREREAAANEGGAARRARGESA